MPRHIRTAVFDHVCLRNVWIASGTCRWPVSSGSERRTSSQMQTHSERLSEGAIEKRLSKHGRRIIEKVRGWKIARIARRSSVTVLHAVPTCQMFGKVRGSAKHSCRVWNPSPHIARSFTEHWNSSSRKHPWTQLLWLFSHMQQFIRDPFIGFIRRTFRKQLYVGRLKHCVMDVNIKAVSATYDHHRCSDHGKNRRGPGFCRQRMQTASHVMLTHR